MLSYFLTALGLMLVIEGLMPFLFPASWRAALIKLAQFQDGQIRTIGLLLLLSGLVLINWIR
ncbi:MAG: hypothetical protein B7Y56_12010 [Gallionellales bacterium 35-53-114]|jgi:uncharacterized protein YjeT (DUF2065 family)|nr:MAG: hypothetical protein B7Y56_12010 [Gallionellales bacterium 35-53-114]OYZ64680.1 MAG: hypothetical protein B7Y04_02590 [Gallionellales bacterium 24-53-125]OZB07781.1 MAG: hypothetical protein B7X61_14425 [Gallionellales bacterium 39-52-133]HQS58505.1 DUF2065 domain-containing protein [Gallionellaceae bacterium]HQS74846.1 DUF2065 domain-containing protein [Gallionellaceae bacterium]